MLGILAGLEWIHRKGFIFVDLKPSNLMLQDGHVVFIDFGSCAKQGATDAVEGVTPTYAADAPRVAHPRSACCVTLSQV